MSSKLTRWLVPIGCALLYIGSMLRCYRRFVFDEPEGRVFGLADDVYISACFGRSLFEGDGFVWYAGAPRIEGISNPLWSAAIGALHALPGFTADRLGAFVVGLNALLLAAATGWFYRGLERTASPPAWFGLVLVPGSIAVAYWSAEGFEIALLAALCFGMLWLAQAADLRRAGFGLAGLFVLGIATRMDFALLAVPALAIYAARRPALRDAALAVGATLLLTAALLIARKAYYGDWLPNTYYLKTTGWPLSERLARGYGQNRALVWIAPLPWLALVWPRARHRLRERAPQAFAAWFGFGLTVAYSTYVGGDAWRSFGGYDRHTAVGGMLLVWGLWLAASACAPRPRASALACLIVLPIVYFPLWHEDRAARVREALFSDVVPTRTLERDWIRYGKAFSEIAPPSARIAVCPAGAIIYFSRRGGVDLLGKVDPFVARLPVSPRKPRNNVCWRNAPGHNKEDDEAMFELRKPEYSRYRPPPSAASRYAKQKHEGFQFFRRVHD